MSFAPHTNEDVLRQLRNGIVPTEVPLILGQFVEKDFDNTFEFAERRWPSDDFAPEFPHVIYTTDGPRLAKVLKTVAYVVVDENEDGPVVAKWQTKQYREYDTDWVKG